jgi:branched-chain amino acid aminotransferase
MLQKTVSTQLKPIPPAKDLRFGQVFTDHWYRARFSEGKGWMESVLEPYGKLSLDPAASVLHYGQALFEGMKAFRFDDGTIHLFRPEFNFQRMCQGAERLCLAPPSQEIFMQGLKELIQIDQRWVPSEPGCSLYIRPALIGTEAFLGVRPSREVLFFIILSPVGAYYADAPETVRIWVEEKSVRAVPGGLGFTKAAANYAASLQAGLQARAKGFAQVLWLDKDHAGIEEVGTMNVFFVFKDEIVTPALNGSILSGNVRESVLHLLRHEGRKVSERKLTIQEVLDRHHSGELLEAFGTGTAAVISPIGELNFRGEALRIHDEKVGPLARHLRERLEGIQRGKITDSFGWMVPLETL